MSAVLAADRFDAAATLQDVLNTTAQDFEIRPLPRDAGAVGNLGAEVLGLDLSQPISQEDFERLQQAH